MIGTTVGSYKILELLGQGGMSSVYLAEHVQIGKRVAMKVLDGEFSRDERIVTRFVDEARAAAKVSHPAIIEIHDFGRHTDGRAFLIMELLEGENLAQHLHRDGPVGERMLVDVVRQAARALAAAHAAGVVHRDLKPANLFLTNDDAQPSGVRVRVLDFGVARLADAQRERLTLSGVIVGTPTYMAPEQCKNPKDVDERTDVYALGCMAFEMATGRPPFIVKGTGALMNAHVYEPPPIDLLKGVLSQGVGDVIASALVKTREARIQSMNALIAALDAAGELREAARREEEQRVTAPIEIAGEKTLVDEKPPDFPKRDDG